MFYLFNSHLSITIVFRGIEIGHSREYKVNSRHLPALFKKNTSFNEIYSHTIKLPFHYVKRSGFSMFNVG